jgi:hypothetical protein
MATPMRMRYRLDAPGGVREVELVSTAPSSAAPLVVLVGAIGPAFLARAEARLARAGYSVVASGDDLGLVDAVLVAAEAGQFGSVPMALGVVALPGLPAASADRVARVPGVAAVLAWPAGAEDESVDTLVRLLASRLP